LDHQEAIAMDEELGERDLIRRISEALGLEKDDCAVLEAGDRYLVATTDMLHRETDFPEIMSPWQMGWMAMAVNLSDVAAMGADPAGVLMAVGLPKVDLPFIDQLFAGFADCAESYGTRIVGGDTDSHRELTIVGCALGFVEKELILRRRGARIGDLLCTTGALGGAGGGLWALGQDDLQNPLLASLLEPKPRIEEGRALAKSRAATAMMDNSDGLALSLYDLGEASNVGFLVRASDLPMASGLLKTVGRKSAIDLIFSAGGDFELLFTVRPDKLEEARRACQLTVIGRAVESGIWMESGGQKIEIEPRGYEHIIGR
jgi:thiamine-monophosphate kinase